MNNMQKRRTLLKIVFGLVAGFLSGFFGGGGGMIVVPFLEKALKKPAKTAHATAILIILPVTAVGALVYVLSRGFDWGTGLPAGGGILLGGMVGAALLNKFSNRFIKVLFALIMIVAGIRMIL
ncbi:hypothetical protein FACS1894211_13310 [Clostridia bacterium]|nr:hypothetical protein FACS1894211_13310 [Clostridia bacterium]